MALLRWGEFQAALDLSRACFSDPKVLAPFAKLQRQRARAFLDGQGEGSWAPPAESTQEKWDRAGTSDITKHGQVRVSKLRALDKQIERMVQRAGKGGWGDADRKKIKRLKRRADQLRRAGTAAEVKAGATAGKVAGVKAKMAALTAKLRELHQAPNRRGVAERRQKLLARLLKMKQGRDKAESAAAAAQHATTYQGRDIGEREGATRKLMPRMPGTIRASVKKLSRGRLLVHTYSRAGQVGYLHHTGQANNAPQRTIVPPPNEEDLHVAVALLEGRSIAPWKG